MDDGTRVAENVERFLRAARAKEVGRCAEMLKEQPELLNSVEAGGFGALHFAAFNGDLEMMRMLLEYKDSLSVDLENYDGNTPLVMAIKGHQTEAVQLLVKAGADVNKTAASGSTPVYHAAAMGFVDLVRLLVELGAKLLLPPSEAGSVLHWACHSGDVNCVGAMIYEFEIPVDVRDTHGGTALLTALFMKRTEVVEFLLEHGANPNISITEDGTTPLHIAVEHANTECVKLLCACGADVAAVNRDGDTPADLARKTKNEAAVRELGRTQVPQDRRVAEALRAKDQGNKVFSQGENVKAAKFYTLAIHLDCTNHVFYSNRAACYFNQKYYMAAYWDAWRCITLKPDWAKGYLRRSVTEVALKRYNDAAATVTQGLRVDPHNKDLLAVKEEIFRQHSKQ